MREAYRRKGWALSEIDNIKQVMSQMKHSQLESSFLFLKPFMFLICNLFSYFSHFLCNSIETAIPEPFNFSVSGKVGKTNFKSRKMKAV